MGVVAGLLIGLFAVIILAVLLHSVIASIFLFSEQVDFEGFDNRFPPISDDEFVARCGPGTDRDVALKVRRIVSDQLSLPYDQIHPSASFVDDLYAD